MILIESKFPSKKSILFIFAALLFAASFAQQKNAPYVILVSFDGFRSDYVDKLDLPNFKAFIKNGTKAEGIIPCFPSVTFPNHYSLVTGLYPGTHGLVNNSFYDASTNTMYSYRNKKRVADPVYYGGTSLWELARQHGIKSASYFWVGSEQSEKNKQPDYFYPYEESVPFQERIDQVLAWLKLPEAERPHFITLYFSIPDHQSHDYGPWGEATKKIVYKADSLLGNLMKGIQETKLPVNTILVSDHGMSELTVAPETTILVNELVNLKDSTMHIVVSSTQTHLYIQGTKKCDSLYAALKRKEKNFTVLRKNDFPPHWHYQHKRVGDLLLVASPYHNFLRGDRALPENQKIPGNKFGVHGYDPALVKDVYGIFYAQGPNIKAGLTLPAIQNIDVYPLVARILNLTLPPIDGNPKTLKKVYKK